MRFGCRAAIATLAWLAGTAASGAGQSVDETIVARADKILAQMTTTEKVGQLNQLFLNLTEEDIDDRVRAGEFGAFLYARNIAQINHLQHLAIDQSRMHIPLLFGLDVINGYRTMFPAPIALAASWDPVLVENARSIAAREARAAGVAWTFAPMLDIARDPRWGRIVEGAGEDPFLGAAIGRAQVRGFQGTSLAAPDRVLATAKHFAGYGAADGGRDYDTASIPENLLWNVYLPPFRAAIDAGVGSVMSAYMDLNDIPASGNKWLLQDVLRGSLGFKGMVVSDAFAIRSLTIHGYARDEKDAARRSVAAGVDMDMDGRVYPNELPALVASGEISIHRIDDMARRVLVTKLRLGLFEHPYVDESRLDATLTAPAHRDVARFAAERSAVLLRNEKGFLPLDRKAVKSIAVIGPLGNSAQDMLGPWTAQADLTETVTVADGLRAFLGRAAKITDAPGVQISRLFPSMFDEFYQGAPEGTWPAEKAATEMKRAVALAAESDLAVMVLGEAYNMSGEDSSRASLTLPGEQRALLEAVLATKKPVALVLIGGRPLDITWAAERVPAILEAWYPGTKGGDAIARLLFGDVSPGGKLPITWPRSVGQLPFSYARNMTQAPDRLSMRTWDELATPLYPFGFGLSYAYFAFANLRVEKPTVKRGESVAVAVDVENTADRPVDAVVQLYLHQRAGSASRPMRELKGFQRIALKPHEKRTVRLEIGPDERRYWSAAERTWVEEAEAFDVWVGEDSTAELHGAFSVTP